MIGERLGIWFDESQRDLLEDKLSDQLAELGTRSFLDYFYRLKYGASQEDCWQKLINALSVQETYFWREIDQINAFVEVLVPRHVSNLSESVKIWSAACATGDEPLTLAIALNEAGWFDRTDIEIWASDISPAALEKAERGIYRERSFRALPDKLREKYFKPVDGGWQVDAKLKARINYRLANIMNAPETALLHSSRYIFCRNVFIYFSKITIRDIVNRWANHMPTPAYLITGVAESLIRTSDRFDLEQIQNAFFYVKR
ncbi:protein-glutamate O-methyltransferase CheR [bacterium]|nr:protein-glutamate O-methyltransferase CheR [bacterium]